MSEKWAAAAFAVGVVTVACSGDGAGRGADTDDVPLRSAVVAWRIGAPEGTGPEVFGRIGGIAVDEAGRILVLDHQASEIRVFDHTGRHQFSFGRPGAGPSALSAPCCIAFDADGRLWVRDNGNGRYVAFVVDDADAVGVATVRMHHGDVNRWAPTTFDPEGRLIDIGMRPDPGSGRHVTTRLHIDEDSNLAFELALPDAAIPVHTVQVRVEGGMATRFFYPPYGPSHLFAHGPDGHFAEAISSDYRIRWHAHDGTLLRTLKRPNVLGPPLTAPQRARADSALTADERRFGTSMPFRVPDRAQPLAALHFDEAGRLWVRLTVPPGEPGRAHVYDLTGRHVETVEWPAGLDLSVGVVRSDVLVGVTRDELEVPYVTRMHLR